MYAIGNIIYGVPLTPQAVKAIEDTGDSIDPYFEALYSGNASSAIGYCGVKLGEIDECTDAVRITPDGLIPGSIDGIMKPKAKIPLAPTPAQKLEVVKKLAKLPKCVAGKLPPPGVYLVWSSS